MPPITHSKLGASSSKRWINCPGSVRECLGIPNKSSVYADEGTAAHFLAEQCLRSGKDAAEFLGRQIVVPVDNREPFFAPSDVHFDEAFEVIEDMAEAVQVYLDTVREILASNPGAELRVEHKFHLTSLHEELWGTCDCVIVLPFDRLIVLDYKHGQGVAVDAEGNTQGMMYARGAAESEDLEDIEIVIVQPRAVHKDGPVRSWRITRTELFKWAEDVLLPAALATEDPNAPLAAGEWCRFCPAGAVCPEKRRAAFADAAVSFDDGMFPVPVEQQPPLPDIRSLTPEQISRILQVQPLLMDFLNDVKTYAREGLENGRFRPGEDGCDFKLVQGRKGNRKYTNEKTAMGGLFPVLRGKSSHVKLVTPAEARRRIEAGLKDGSISEKSLNGKTPQQFVDQFCYRPDGGIHLVPLSDPREAGATQTAEEAFDEAPYIDVVPVAEEEPAAF